MLLIFLIVFVICLISNYIKDGGSFVFFSRVVEMANSIHEPSPRGVKHSKYVMQHEYKYNNRIYSIIVPIKIPLRWTTAAGLIGSDWIQITKEMEYHAGPSRDFYGIPVTPEHINTAYDKIAFKFPGNTIVRVDKNEIIIIKLKKANKEIKD